VVEGPDPQYADVRNGTRLDDFDAYSVSRDRRYERPRATAYVSPQMVGYADLDEYGTWQASPEYGPVWYPTAVAADWAPYRDGYWTNVGGWGSTWVDAAPWGYAPFHYGRGPGSVDAGAGAPGRRRAAQLGARVVAWVGGARWGLSCEGGPGWLSRWVGASQSVVESLLVQLLGDFQSPVRRQRRDTAGQSAFAFPQRRGSQRRPLFLVRHQATAGRINRMAVLTHLMTSAPVLAAAPAVATGPLRIWSSRRRHCGTPPRVDRTCVARPARAGRRPGPSASTPVHQPGGG
jgi:hypothetical protein